MIASYQKIHLRQDHSDRSSSLQYDHLVFDVFCEAIAHLLYSAITCF
ncbi:MAG: hypothetical protein NHB32_28720 [Fischerella sp. CENA71]|nr:hypothetical protein [Fischerella sp. CENA71]